MTHNALFYQLKKPEQIDLNTPFNSARQRDQPCDSVPKNAAKPGIGGSRSTDLRASAMDKCRPGGMDFDAWLEVARRDPQAFEALRVAAIEEAIAKAPQANQVRLRRLQWRIDQERRLARTPIDACIRTSRLMWRNVIGPGGLQERLNELHARLSGTPGPRSTSADVVAFARD